MCCVVLVVFVCLGRNQDEVYFQNYFTLNVPHILFVCTKRVKQTVNLQWRRILFVS